MIITDLTNTSATLRDTGVTYEATLVHGRWSVTADNGPVDADTVARITRLLTRMLKAVIIHEVRL